MDPNRMGSNAVCTDRRSHDQDQSHVKPDAATADAQKVGQEKMLPMLKGDPAPQPEHMTTQVDGPKDESMAELMADFEGAPAPRSKRTNKSGSQKQRAYKRDPRNVAMAKLQAELEEARAKAHKTTMALEQTLEVNFKLLARLRERERSPEPERSIASASPRGISGHLNEGACGTHVESTAAEPATFGTITSNAPAPVATTPKVSHHAGLSLMPPPVGSPHCVTLQAAKSSPAPPTSPPRSRSRTPSTGTGDAMEEDSKLPAEPAHGAIKDHDMMLTVIPEVTGAHKPIMHPMAMPGPVNERDERLVHQAQGEGEDEDESMDFISAAVIPGTPAAVIELHGEWFELVDDQITVHGHTFDRIYQPLRQEVRPRDVGGNSDCAMGACDVHNTPRKGFIHRAMGFLFTCGETIVKVPKSILYQAMGKLQSPWRMFPRFMLRTL
jgi:hypothetical protein